jgi:hypothetical protein
MTYRIDAVANSTGTTISFINNTGATQSIRHLTQRAITATWYGDGTTAPVTVADGATQTLQARSTSVPITVDNRIHTLIWAAGYGMLKVEGILLRGTGNGRSTGAMLTATFIPEPD